MLPDLLQATNEQSAQSIRIKKVTLVGTVADIMNTSLVNKAMLSEVDTLLKLYYTIPMTTATSERSFSTLRRLKSYLRSTMTQSRLNHIMLLHVHKELTDNIDLLQVAKYFIGVNERRRNFGSIFQ